MFCEKCGAEIAESASFCSGCGSKVDEQQTANQKGEKPKAKQSKNGARTAKLIIGIISIVLFVVIAFQSCAVGVGYALTGEEGTSAGTGLLVALFMLISGIVGISTRSSKSGGITAGVFYALAGLFGLGNAADFPDLEIWSFLCLIFAVIYIAGSIRMTKKQ